METSTIIIAFVLDLSAPRSGTAPILIEELREAARERSRPVPRSVTQAVGLWRAVDDMLVQKCSPLLHSRLLSLCLNGSLPLGWVATPASSPSR